MNYNDVIAARHSVRRFQDKEVARDLIDAMILQAQTAPSSKNTKSSAFLVVDDPDTIVALSEMRTSGSTFMKGAKAAIVVMGDTTKTDLYEVNSAISATILQLSAVNLGLGSCWVQVAGRPRSKDGRVPGLAEDYVRELLGIPEHLSVLCVLALGYEAAQD